MAIVAEPEFMDGFDGLSAAQITRKWNTGSVTIQSPGRSGIANSQSVTITSPLQRAVTETDSGIIQFAWKSPTTPISNGVVIASFWHSAHGGHQLTLASTGTGILFLVNGQTFGLVGSATDPLQSLVLDTWYVFEFAATMHTSAGKADVKVNGQPITGLFGLTGKSTCGGAFNSYDSVNISYGGDSRYDDFYFRKAPGGYNNAADFLGDIVIETVYPDAVSGDAGHTQGTIYGTATNRYDGIDEINASDDETSGVDLTANNQKLYTSFGSLVGPAGATISTIHGVQLNVIARKTDPGFSHSLKPGCVKVGTYGTDYLGTEQSLQDTFTDKRKAWAVRPDGSGAWTTTDIATGWEWGCERIT